MTARGGSFVVLVFAAVWLWIGASALPTKLNAMVGAVGVTALMAIAWRLRSRPTSSGQTGRFDRRIFWGAVAFEVIAGNLVGIWLGRTQRLDYLWPAFGIVVALHFIGLWWASHDRRFLTLTVGMGAINLLALFFPPGRPAMLAISGLGSSAALAAAAAVRR